MGAGGRAPEQLVELAARFPAEVADCSAQRPLLGLAASGDLGRLRTALLEEMAIEQENDRVYWEPLKKELEGWRKREAGA